MKGFSVATSVALVLFALAVGQYQTNSAHKLLSKIANTLSSLFFSRTGPGNAAGIFAQGCRWRDAPVRKPAAGSSQGFWDIRHYEYWNETTHEWSLQQPAACRLQPLLFKDSLLRKDKDNNSPSTQHRYVQNDYCVFENLWYNEGKFYYLTDDADGMVRL